MNRLFVAIALFASVALAQTNPDSKQQARPAELQKPAPEKPQPAPPPKATPASATAAKTS